MHDVTDQSNSFKPKGFAKPMEYRHVGYRHKSSNSCRYPLHVAFIPPRRATLEFLSTILFFHAGFVPRGSRAVAWHDFNVLAVHTSKSHILTHTGAHTRMESQLKSNTQQCDNQPAPIVYLSSGHLRFSRGLHLADFLCWPIILLTAI